MYGYLVVSIHVEVDRYITFIYLSSLRDKHMQTFVKLYISRSDLLNPMGQNRISPLAQWGDYGILTFVLLSTVVTSKNKLILEI